MRACIAAPSPCRAWSERILRALALALAFSGTRFHPIYAAEKYVDMGPDGHLSYESDAKGNRMPDFSYAGYGGGGVPLPNIPARVSVTAAQGDDGARIQAALDYVASLPLDANGFRGAVVLERGQFQVAGQLVLRASGVVLRGQGTGPNETTLIATGQGRRNLIEIHGASDKRVISNSHTVTDDYVPVNSRTLTLDSIDGLKVGDMVSVTRPSPKNWIEFMGMGPFPERPNPTWKADRMDINWERKIEAIDGETITLDAPLTCALDAKFGGAKVQAYEWPGRVRNVGIENLSLDSTWDKSNPKDEEHAWMAVTLENAEDAWVRNVSATHFVSSAVSIWETCRRVTVQDCASSAPVSEMGGYRRHTFYTDGGQTLFLRCRADEGRHDFAVGWVAPGPNVFVSCEAQNAHSFSGPIESWATGVLLDNVKVDGAGLLLDNRELWDNGVGWAAANSVLWQSSAAVIIARTPPGAQNWVIGCWAQFAGDATWRSPNEFVNPDSLYTAQLKDRLGAESEKVLAEVKFSPFKATLSVDELLRQHPQLIAKAPTPTPYKVSFANGWLTVDGKLLLGRQREVTWWRGTVLPSRFDEFGDSITRFVPGRQGKGWTDDLIALANNMVAKGNSGIRHHWGLWYERRADDHEMIRRPDGDVWPPFYEQPWARTGQGTNWNGISRYDLTKYNPWYFGRLRQFAGLCDQKGLLLVNEMYFQHNILEAGAHWANFPWRTANNINNPGFPEPVPYVGGKRIFMADLFYDEKNPVRRPLHQAYIRQCLNNLSAENNVLHIIGDEFTGPTHFMQFWVDEVAKWRRDTKKQAFIGLSAPKNVQDAILNDPKRAAQIDAIDFKYWWQTKGGLYAPDGGRNMSPRQEERLSKLGRPSEVDLARMASEYRGRFPAKVVMCDTTNFDSAAWSFVCAGGSLPTLPITTDKALLQAIPKMQPWKAGTTNTQWTLRQPGVGFLVHSSEGAEITLDLSGEQGTYQVSAIDEKTGLVSPTGETVTAGKIVVLKKPAASTTFWLQRQ